MKLIRKQIYLEKDDSDNLQKLALFSNKSTSKLIRIAIKEYIKRNEKKNKSKSNPLLKLIGICKTGKVDASINHDKYLYKKDKR